ncbi:MAG: hypothetical protein ACLS37_13145 [Alistipes sp.]
MAECRQLMTLDLTDADVSRAVVDEYLIRLPHHYGRQLYSHCPSFLPALTRNPCGMRTANVSPPPVWKRSGCSLTRRAGTKAVPGSSVPLKNVIVTSPINLEPMSRTLKEIYDEAVRERNKRMELNEFSSDSKLSILNGIAWTVAAVIHSFETLLDVFAYDISETINRRINGTPDYYARALLQYQKGDELTV